MGWMSLPARKQIPGQAGDDGKNFSYSESKEGLKKPMTIRIGIGCIDVAL